MRRRLLELIGLSALILAVIVLLKLAPVSLAGQAPKPAASASAAEKAEPAAKTPWGETDL